MATESSISTTYTGTWQIGKQADGLKASVVHQAACLVYGTPAGILEKAKNAPHFQDVDVYVDGIRVQGDKMIDGLLIQIDPYEDKLSTRTN
jgi:hypothetical protein